ncbi:MAG: pantetheine-phosphate adenylyltransferase [Gammaproteobacteria bacterium]|nr:pantetheine-phosphate adenylyltransferase [Gammaproteobacteria bacterium]NNJ83605.1 pantetheine-phosphate adenylyltransferase [Gammaproteobacteria bacterium]
MKTKALYPGTFDPITNGHVDLVARAAVFFHEIIVGVAESTVKNPLLSFEKRLELAEIALAPIANARVCGFNGLVSDLADQLDAHVMLRGVRSNADFENEFQRANINRMLNPGLETIFMTPGENFAHISSSLVREVTLAGGDASRFVHPAIKIALDNRLAKLRLKPTKHD